MKVAAQPPRAPGVAACVLSSERGERAGAQREARLQQRVGEVGDAALHVDDGEGAMLVAGEVVTQAMADEPALRGGQRREAAPQRIEPEQRPRRGEDHPVEAGAGVAAATAAAAAS